MGSLNAMEKEGGMNRYFRFVILPSIYDLCSLANNNY